MRECMSCSKDMPEDEARLVCYECGDKTHQQILVNILTKINLRLERLENTVTVEDIIDKMKEENETRITNKP